MAKNPARNLGRIQLFIQNLQRTEIRLKVRLHHYLNAEYNFAHGAAEMAAKWEKFEEDGDEYLLQYQDRLRHQGREDVLLKRTEILRDGFKIEEADLK